MKNFLRLIRSGRLAWIILTMALFCQHPPARAATKPNEVSFLADDLDKPDLEAINRSPTRPVVPNQRQVAQLIEQ